MQFVSVVGTRPQLIKASAIDHELITNWPYIKHMIIHTGQHYDSDLSNNIIGSTGLTGPHINLSVGSGLHGQMTGKMIVEIESELIKLKPDWCLNYGDTNTTLATAIAAAKIDVKTAHIEAGMRRYDLSIPEEINRRVTDHISNLLFVSSENYANNLYKETVPGEIINVGDINLDSFGLMMQQLRERPRAFEGQYVLSTVHRPVNTDSKETLRGILKFLGSIPSCVILPLHPRTLSNIERYGLKFPRNIKVNAPLPFDRMLLMLRDCDFVVTDSGGLQKEAFFAGKRCITLNTDTPWIELKQLDVNWPVDPKNFNYSDIENWCKKALPKLKNPYGDGNSRKRIVKALVERT